MCILYVVFMYVQMWVSVCVSLYMHGMRVLDMCMHTYVCAYVHAYVCMCVCACICKSQTYFRDKVGFGRTKLHF